MELFVQMYTASKTVMGHTITRPTLVVGISGEHWLKKQIEKCHLENQIYIK